MKIHTQPHSPVDSTIVVGQSRELGANTSRAVKQGCDRGALALVGIVAVAVGGERQCQNMGQLKVASNDISRYTLQGEDVSTRICPLELGTEELVERISTLARRSLPEIPQPIDAVGKQALFASQQPVG